MSLSCRFGVSPVSALPKCRTATTRRVQKLPVRCEALSGQGSPLDLPGGAGVWLGSQRGSTEILYGTSYGFVLRRDKIGGEGLVVRPKAPKPVPRARQHRASQQLARHGLQQQQGLQRLSLVGLGVAGYVIDTEFEIVEPEIQPNTTCTGIVPLSLLTEQQREEPAATKHPRRTLKVSFTCNLCGTSNVRATNPHAWQRGSVFMRCEGCSAVHKMRDNLKIFHELKGPVFPPPHLRNSFLLQELLDKIEACKRQQPGGGPDSGLLN